MVDPIADFLARIRNAQMARKTELTLPYSKTNHEIAKVMQKNHFLNGVEKLKDEAGKFFVLKIDLPQKEIELKRISKCGQRIYVKSDEIRRVNSGYGISIISTSKGVMTGYEAHAKKIGGEVLCEIA